MEINKLYKALKKSWCRETCYPGQADDWSEDNPSLGQCVVTALVVQDYFGGILASCRHTHHYWNIIKDGRVVDLTRDQFDNSVKICTDNYRLRSSLLTGSAAKQARTKKRYLLLKKLVKKHLQESEGE